MTSFADLALLLTVLATGANGPGVPPELAARVAAAVGAAWDAPAAELALEWGAVARPLRDDEPFRLAGRCEGGWFVVVFDPAGAAAAVRLRAGVPETTWVAARALASGAALTEDDVQARVRRRWGPPGVRGERPAPGWQVRRPLATGEALAWPAVSPAPLVAAGSPVRLTWERGPVRIALDGIALNDARAGAPVRARVAGRRGWLTAIAAGPGRARLTQGGGR